MIKRNVGGQSRIIDRYIMHCMYHRRKLIMKQCKIFLAYMPWLSRDPFVCLQIFKTSFTLIIKGEFHRIKDVKYKNFMSVMTEMFQPVNQLIRIDNQITNQPLDASRVPIPGSRSF